VVTKKPKRGSFASAKRFQDKPTPTDRKATNKKAANKKISDENAPKGRGRFAKSVTKPKSKAGTRPPRNTGGKAYGKPGGKMSGKFAPRGQGRGKK